MALDQLEKYGTGRPKSSKHTEIYKEYTAAMDGIWVNGQDVDSTLATQAEKINKILAS